MTQRVETSVIPQSPCHLGMWTRGRKPFQLAGANGITSGACVLNHLQLQRVIAMASRQIKAPSNDSMSVPLPRLATIG